MAKMQRKKREKRETQALLRAEMAEPRMAESVRVREAELRAAKAKRGARVSGMRNRTDKTWYWTTESWGK